MLYTKLGTLFIVFFFKQSSIQKTFIIRRSFIYLFNLLSVCCDSKPDMRGILTQVKISNAHKYYYSFLCFPFFFSAGAVLAETCRTHGVVVRTKQRWSHPTRFRISKIGSRRAADEFNRRTPTVLRKGVSHLLYGTLTHFLFSRKLQHCIAIPLDRVSLLTTLLILIEKTSKLFKRHG